MFKASKKESQLKVFSNISNMLNNISLNHYNDATKWHNMFREQITHRVDEQIFSVLYADTMGAPNASISLLTGMMVLKESFNWSDAQLFESCRFNLLTRSALGLFNMDDAIPAESTYYLFRKRLYEYQKETGKDLLEEVFARITKEQIAEFEINGQSIRMDSKLIGSNIAYYSRYEIIHQTLILFCKSMVEEAANRLTKKEKEQIRILIKEEPEKIVYRSSVESIKERMNRFGLLIYKLLAIHKPEQNEYYQTLQRVFNDQYNVGAGKGVNLRGNEEVKADSVQSPHDPDAEYRKKGDESVKGYNVNITEICDPDKPKLITSVQIEGATTPDNDFLVEAVEKTVEILGHQVENLHADGAYNSQINQEYTKEGDINFYLTGIQGNKGRYDLSLNGEELEVSDTQTGEVTIAKCISENKWRIETEKGYRYFTRKDIEICLLRKAIKETPSDKKKIRNNVEAAMYHLSCGLRNNKTKYRGIIKQKMWATLRCLWINLVRITNFKRNTPPKMPILFRNAVKQVVITDVFCCFNRILDKFAAITQKSRFNKFLNCTF